MTTETVVVIVIAAFFLFLAYLGYRKSARAKREKLIDSYRFPESIAAKVSQTYPHLTEQQVNQVMRGLREYFHVCNVAGRRVVSMPSQAVDVAWHEFILFTRVRYRHRAWLCGAAHLPAISGLAPHGADRI